MSMFMSVPRYSVPLKVRRRRRPAARHDAISQAIRLGASDFESPRQLPREHGTAMPLRADETPLNRPAPRKYLAWSRGGLSA